MVWLICHSPTPRVDYIFQYIFNDRLHLGHTVVANLDEVPADADLVINYNRTSVEGAMNIWSDGILQESGIRQYRPELDSSGKHPHIFNVPGDAFDLSFDPFAACFYLLCGYEQYAFPAEDQHGRYNERRNSLRNYYHLPLVDLYIGELTELIERYISLPRTNQFDFHVTYDIDAPWAFKNKNWLINVAGIGKDLLHAEYRQLSRRLQTMLGGKDPYDTYDIIRQHSGPEYTTFFFLMKHVHGIDARISEGSPKYASLIRELAGAGYQVGLHPSYHTYLDKDQMLKEKKVLESMLGKPVTRSRQHYLRVKLPETYNFLEQVGIKEDYSACLTHYVGFRYFCADTFPWFNLVKNQTSGLRIHPSMVMDRTLEHYLQLSPEKALAKVKSCIDMTASVNGNFVLLLHNESFSEFREWAGWRRTFLEVIDYLKGKRAANAGRSAR